MIKHTFCFSNPVRLSLASRQLVIITETDGEARKVTRPIEDIGVIIIDNPRITFTSAVMQALLDNNCALITCDCRHMPQGLMLPLESNTVQSERFNNQISASLPLKKQLWQQTIAAKITNQVAVLARFSDSQTGCMEAWSRQVKSGDADNLEGRAAAYYWRNLMDAGFRRHREGDMPNNLLNYGYAILRAVIARSLVGSGLLPTLGIHHHNRYNAYCLADDIMEPYRPYVDSLVMEVLNNNTAGDLENLTPAVKKQLLVIPAMDVVISGRRRPLMVAASETSSSLARCFSGEIRKIAYPQIQKIDYE